MLLFLLLLIMNINTKKSYCLYVLFLFLCILEIF